MCILKYLWNTIIFTAVNLHMRRSEHWSHVCFNGRTRAADDVRLTSVFSLKWKQLWHIHKQMVMCECKRTDLNNLRIAPWTKTVAVETHRNEKRVRTNSSTQTWFNSDHVGLLSMRFWQYWGWLGSLFSIYLYCLAKFSLCIIQKFSRRHFNSRVGREQLGTS